MFRLNIVDDNIGLDFMSTSKQNDLILLWHALQDMVSLEDEIYLKDDLRMSSYARAMIEFQADVELKDTIVVAMPKLIGQGFYTCTVRVEYEWKPPRCVCVKFFGHIQEECPKNPGLGVAKNLKKNSRLLEVDYLVDHDSEDEVGSVDNDMARSMASEKVGFGMNGLLE
ncbi:hypothetical protein Tco_1408974 [Tanacetum coccineum]